jgi:hypothetical protein
MKSNIIEDVIILGAGASRPDGAPLQKDFIREYSTIVRNKRSGLNEMDKRLYKFFKKVFKIDISAKETPASRYPTFEEIMGVIELALSKGETFKGIPQTSVNPVLQSLHDDLIFMMATVIDKGVRRGPQFHKTLVDRLKNGGHLRNTAFISLNYDIFIDNALIKAYPEYHLDYGISLENYKTRTGGFKKPDPNKAVKLLKMHGSLNWLFCPTCTTIELTPKEKGAAKLLFKPRLCSRCRTAVIPIIVPPTYFKIFSNYYLNEVWHLAEEILGGAKRFFFCGYSFPDADIYFKYLLKRVQINRVRYKREVFVINYHDNKQDDAIKAEIDRYERFLQLGNKDTLIYLRLSFEDFARLGIPKNKALRLN